MRPLYLPNKNYTIGYAGNNICKPIKQISMGIDPNAFHSRVEEFRTTKKWGHVAKINHTIATSVNEYFDKIGSIFTLLPLTTRMISSPSALYGRRHTLYI